MNVASWLLRAQLVIGSILSVIAMVLFLGTLFGSYFPSSSSQGSIRSVATINTHDGLAAGQLGPIVRKANLAIQYPPTMRVNQTLTVSSTYTIEIEQGISRLQTMRLTTLDRDITVALSSSGFMIEPSAPVDHDQKAKLPVSTVWTI